ncbi:MAG: DUF5615 family PIN-like protein [Anaerolineae bacterium]
MRLLADENFPGLAVRRLRVRGHDVAWIREVAPGSKDPDVLARAQLESRILITFDKDFGELAFRWGLSAASGIVLFRITMPSAEYVADVAASALESRDDRPGHFAVVEDRRIRLLSLPQS